jgi:type VI secretion system protein ImpK
MAEESKQAFDPEATVAQPVAAVDPDATVTQPVPAVDPEATVSGPALRAEPDPEATDSRPAFDPDATDRRAAFDFDTTIRARFPGRLRANPFAPKSPPDTIQANLSALGGINPLVAMANPILAAVPQIRRTLKHANPAALQASLRDQLEALETSAFSAEISDETIGAATYALCALLDESAAATPWGRDWIAHGLLQALRGESNGAEGFFALLDRIAQEPEKNADLLEFLYICLALGFEGRYRGADGGRQALDQVRERLYAQIALRRPRPEALSPNWRTPASQATADAALLTAARANAARAAAEAAARAAEAATQPAAAAGRFALSRWPRRAIWSAVASIVGAVLVFYMLALRLQDDVSRDAAAPTDPGAKLATTDARQAQAQANPASAPAPAEPAAAAVLARSLTGLPVKVTPGAGGATIELQVERQFASGSATPAASVAALLPKIAEALDLVPGKIVVAGHADATPPGHRYASNAELSAARARAVARMMAKKLADPKRLAAEGRGDGEPVAPNSTEAGRAKNRRVVIQLKPAS